MYADKPLFFRRPAGAEKYFPYFSGDLRHRLISGQPYGLARDGHGLGLCVLMVHVSTLYVRFLGPAGRRILAGGVSHRNEFE